MQGVNPQLKRVVMRANQQGFTLLELLVVLTLVAAIAGLFLDPIARVYDLRSRLTAFIDKAADNILPPSWFQKTVKGLYVGEEKFEGTAKRFSGETIASFDEMQGVPMPFAWEIEHNTDTDISHLSYVNAEEEPSPVLVWKGDSGQFTYYDPKDEKWVDEWQSSPFVKKDEYRLPTLIRFEIEREGKPFVIQASLEASRTYLKDTRDDIDRMLENMRDKMAKEKAERGEDQDLASLERKSLLKKRTRKKKKDRGPDPTLGRDFPLTEGEAAERDAWDLLGPDDDDDDDDDDEDDLY